MLSDLHISNFALIEEQKIAFGAGLNILSGETGAGKSIVLQALQFLLGAKLKTDVVRSGAEEAEVQGLFVISKLAAEIREALPDIARGDELILTRSISKAGKSRIFVNGRLANQSILQEISGLLVSVCGQHEQVRLLDGRYHLGLLDSFAGLDDSVKALRLLFDDYSILKREVETLETDSQQLEQRREMLLDKIAELEKVDPVVGLRASLESDVKRYTNAEQIVSLGASVSDQLSGEAGVLEQIKGALVSLQNLARIDPSFGTMCERLQSVRKELLD